MRKAAILVSAALVCGTLVGYLCMKDNQPAQQPKAQQSDPGYNSATTRQPEEYKPAFGAVNIPENKKQHYTINPKSSQVITGESGTMLLIPDHAFTDKNGNAVSGKVKLELVEAITREDLITMNIGTMSDQGMLETGGTIYVGAKSESGEELQLAEGKIIEAEIPATQVRPGMQLWQGQQNADGSVSWNNPEPMSGGLKEVPVASLGDSAQAVAQAIAPAVVGVAVEIPQQLDRTVWLDWQNRVVIKSWGVKANDSIFRWQGDSVVIPGFDGSQDNVVMNADANGLDIVNFADKKFEHTNISTAEFRSRLPYIKQACDARVAHCYADHPTRALWKSDAAIADSLDKTGCPLADLFRQFAAMKQDKVDPKDPNTVAALDAARTTAIANYSKRVADARAAYASYSFGMKALGWANIDRLCGSGSPIVVNAHLEGVPTGLSPTVSLLIPGRGIYLPGYKRPNGDYSFTHGESEQAMAYPQGEHAFILARTGSGDDLSYALKEIVFGGSTVESLALNKGTEVQLAQSMGNMPPEKKEPEVKIIDDWYTQSLQSGTGCLCGWGGINK
jgi:hypothetical protein